MIQLTENETLYPPRPIPPTQVWWRWTRVALWVIIICWVVRWYRQKSSQPITISLSESWDTSAEYTKERWLQELIRINTSIRTPHQKAEAMLHHLLLYIGKDDAFLSTPHESYSYTLAELQNLPEAADLISFFTEIYTIIYTDTHLTHAQINNFTQRLVTHCSWT